MRRAEVKSGRSLFPVFGLAVLALLPACSSMNTLTRGECMEENRSFMFGLPLTSSRAFNKTCGEMHSADLMTRTSDPGLKAVGYSVLKEVSPVFKNSDKEHLRRLVEGPAQLQCEFRGIDRQSGNAIYGNCRRVDAINNPKP